MRADTYETRCDVRAASPALAGKDQVSLYLARYGVEDIGPLAEQYRGLLSKEEREQERRFFFVDDQRRYLVTRALVRTVLSRYVAVDPRDWRFSTNYWGKPAIADPLQMISDLQFNISHTRGLIVLALTRGETVGVDIENVADREAAFSIADHYFTEQEAHELRSLDGEARKERFFTLWTLKEAYIKARGHGLSIPLNQFRFDLKDADQIRFRPSPQLQDNAQDWRFWLFRPIADCLLALCARPVAGLTVSAQWTVPLVKDDVVPLQMLRCSYQAIGDRKGVDC